MANQLWQTGIWQTGKWQNDIISLCPCCKKSFIGQVWINIDERQHPVMTFPIKKRISTELFFARRAEL